ncbi:hypothetical protein Q3G72_025998 [Acer saccharum]|nr:hypothetical protein Q3G72_025998 [Acer saccharum]
MASTSLKLSLTLLCTIFFFSTTYALNISSSTNTSSLDTEISAIKNFCYGTPHPDACFNSLKLSISINISPKIIDYLLQTLQFAISEAGKLINLFFSSNIVEKQRGTIQDCIELHQITLSSLQRSVSKISESDSRKLADARAYLSAALTNKNTCLEGLDSASGSLKPTLVNSLIATYMHVSNSLSMLSRPNPSPKKVNNKNRRLLGLFPKWLSRKDRRILQTSAEEYDPTEVLTVAADGTGNFTTITDAINFAPNNSYDRIIIYVKEGVYEENVEIPTSKTNIVLLGDGSDLTIITGNRSVADGWTTFRSATLAVSGDGFLARDLTVENSAGPEKHQAVALRVNADLTAMYRFFPNRPPNLLLRCSVVRRCHREQNKPLHHKTLTDCVLLLLFLLLMIAPSLVIGGCSSSTGEKEDSVDLLSPEEIGDRRDDQETRKDLRQDGEVQLGV